jgi:hypothetical protein
MSAILLRRAGSSATAHGFRRRALFHKAVGPWVKARLGRGRHSEPGAVKVGKIRWRQGSGPVARLKGGLGRVPRARVIGEHASSSDHGRLGGTLKLFCPAKSLGSHLPQDSLPPPHLLIPQASGSTTALHWDTDRRGLRIKHGRVPHSHHEERQSP